MTDVKIICEGMNPGAPHEKLLVDTLADVSLPRDETLVWEAHRGEPDDVDTRNEICCHLCQVVVEVRMRNLYPFFRRLADVGLTEVSLRGLQTRLTANV